MMLSKQKSKKGDVVLSFFVFGFIMAIAFFLYISNLTEHANKIAELEKIESELLAIEQANERLERYTLEENRAEYIEEIARTRLNLAHPQERIFHIVPAGE
ncbi:MAG: septum formation initiator family protein [Oscillospiraceae bacterium]|nr:septum formation initiator family protein [Oscillospiraceae bacterium]